METVDDELVDERPKRSSTASKDPVAGILTAAVLLMLIVVLASIGILLWYVSSRNEAPRNEAERNLGMAEASVKADSKDVRRWASLAIAQAEVGRFHEAEASIAKGREIDDVSLLAVVYADIANLAGDKGEAIVRYEAAKKMANAEWDARTRRLKDNNTISDEINQTYVEACVGEGRVQLELGHYKEAKAEFDAALKLLPTMADVLAMRGDAEAKMGDAEAARRDYEKALKFDPAMEEALKGMADLEKGR